MSSMAVNDAGKVAEDPGSRKPSCYNCAHTAVCMFWGTLHSTGGTLGRTFPPTRDDEGHGLFSRWYGGASELLASCCDFFLEDEG